MKIFNFEKNKFEEKNCDVLELNRSKVKRIKFVVLQADHQENMGRPVSIKFKI